MPVAPVAPPVRGNVRPRGAWLIALLAALAGGEGCARARGGAGAGVRDAASAATQRDGAAADGHTDAGATDAGATVPQGPFVLLHRGRPSGYLRFVHVARGVGPVRFVAVNEPAFEASRVEATVAPGASSEYLLAVNVPHRVSVFAAGDDPATARPIVPAIVSDVYNNRGCTVAFVGSDASGAGARRLLRVVDVPRRGDAGVALVRFVAAVAARGALEAVARAAGDAGGAGDAGAAGEVVAADVAPFQPTGLRIVPPGAWAWTLRAARGGARIGSPVVATVPAGDAHTLWFYPGASRATRLAALVTRDVP